MAHKCLVLLIIALATSRALAGKTINSIITPLPPVLHTCGAAIRIRWIFHFCLFQLLLLDLFSSKLGKLKLSAGSLQLGVKSYQSVIEIGLHYVCDKIQGLQS